MLLMGKSTINGPFSITMLVYQRVQKTMVLYEKTPLLYIRSGGERTSPAVPDRLIFSYRKRVLPKPPQKKVNLKHKKSRGFGAPSNF